MEGFEKTSACKYGSYNEAAQYFGLLSPIKFGILQTYRWKIYVWYVEYIGKYSFIPLFNNDDKVFDTFEWYQPFEVMQITPGSPFVYNGDIYYYNDEDLSIYMLKDCLNIITMINVIQILNLPYQYANPVRIKIHNRPEEIYAWYLITNDLSKGKFYPIFGNDAFLIKQAEKSRIKMRYVSNGEYIIHGDTVYQFTLNPQTGITIEPVNFDLKKLLIL